MPSYKLCYFPARGLAEMLRLTFAEAGVEYEDVRYSGEEWAKHKPDMLFNQMPVLFVDGVQIAHSRAALRYLAREFKLDGGDSLTAAKVDMWIEVLAETFSKLPFSEKDEKKKEEQTAAVFKDFIVPRLGKLENVIQGDFIFGTNPTIADFAVVGVLALLERQSKQDVLANFPKLKKLKTAVESRPKIAKWIEKRPVTEN